ncbi:hypothetical protein R1flu_007937 [Riccia fluitans]|uniref:Uncharacterized protein n=1 Tax=Riccia fluitans TaxID=41844 RepID=A0ABD1XH45_9MARC
MENHIGKLLASRAGGPQRDWMAKPDRQTEWVTNMAERSVGKCSQAKLARGSNTIMAGSGGGEAPCTDENNRTLAQQPTSRSYKESARHERMGAGIPTWLAERG